MIKKYIIYFVFIIFAVVLTVLTTPGYCEGMDTVVREDVGDYIETKTIEGSVTSVSADGDAFTIRPFVAVDPTNDQFTFEVLPEAEIYKSNYSVTSSDIEVGDVVTVEYYNDSSGFKAKTITIQ